MGGHGHEGTCFVLAFDEVNEFKLEVDIEFVESHNDSLGTCGPWVAVDCES